MPGHHQRVAGRAGPFVADALGRVTGLEYEALDEVCAADEVWEGMHEALRTATSVRREQVARTLLDYMRRELAIDQLKLARVDIELGGGGVAGRHALAHGDGKRRTEECGSGNKAVMQKKKKQLMMLYVVSFVVLIIAVILMGLK